VFDRASARAELRGELLDPREIHVREDDAVAVSVQPARDRLAEPARGPGTTAVLGT